jgi:hypothetical protein
MQALPTLTGATPVPLARLRENRRSPQLFRLSPPTPCEFPLKRLREISNAALGISITAREHGIFRTRVR